MVRYIPESRPPWWPKHLPFVRHFIKSIHETQARLMCMKDLIRKCYEYYNQEKTLYLFDEDPGEELRWEILPYGENYCLYVKETGLKVFTFRTSYQLTPFEALSAQSTEKNRIFKAEKKDKSSPLGVKTAALTRGLSILGSLSPKHTSSTDEAEATVSDLSGAAILPTYFCTCKAEFETDLGLVRHWIQCGFDRKYQSKRQRACYSSVDLFPQQVISMCLKRKKRPSICTRFNVDVDIAKAMELTSELASRVLAPPKNTSVPNIDDLDALCNFVPGNKDQTPPPKREYPVTFRPQKCTANASNVIQYNLNAADRRMSTLRRRMLRRQMKNTGGLRLRVKPLQLGDLDVMNINDQCKSRIKTNLMVREQVQLRIKALKPADIDYMNLNDQCKSALQSNLTMQNQRFKRASKSTLKTKSETQCSPSSKLCPCCVTSRQALITSKLYDKRMQSTANGGTNGQLAPPKKKVARRSAREVPSTSHVDNRDISLKGSEQHDIDYDVQMKKMKFMQLSPGAYVFSAPNNKSSETSERTVLPFVNCRKKTFLDYHMLIEV